MPTKSPDEARKAVKAAFDVMPLPSAYTCCPRKCPNQNLPLDMGDDVAAIFARRRHQRC